jgi:hypothetical protein
MSTVRPEQVLFCEQQRFTQVWLWVLLCAMGALSLWGFVQQIILGRPWGDNPGPDWVVVLMVILVCCGLPLFMYSCRLLTEVNGDALYVRFIPFHFRPVRIDYGTITSCQAVKYSPILEYGGWGLRYGRKGRAYNVSGNLGVRLEFSSGRSLLIGSQHPVELAAAIEQAMGKQAATPPRPR